MMGRKGRREETGEDCLQGTKYELQTKKNMAKCSERVVNAAVNQGKVACFHEDCKESYKFFKEDGIVHHFKTTHHRKNVHLSEILPRAKQFTAQRHGDETALFLHSKFELLFREVSKEKFYRISLDVTFVVYLSY